MDLFDYVFLVIWKEENDDDDDDDDDELEILCS